MDRSGPGTSRLLFHAPRHTASTVAVTVILYSLALPAAAQMTGAGSVRPSGGPLSEISGGVRDGSGPVHQPGGSLHENSAGRLSGNSVRSSTTGTMRSGSVSDHSAGSVRGGRRVPPAMPMPMPFEDAPLVEPPDSLVPLQQQLEAVEPLRPDDEEGELQEDDATTDIADGVGAGADVIAPEEPAVEAPGEPETESTGEGDEPPSLDSDESESEEVPTPEDAVVE